MNGRIYDPEIGRFLSADPFVQFPESTQGFNRYTYVGNNPLSYTDPSGYFSLKKALGKALGAIAPILSVIPGCHAWCTAVAAGVSGYLLTGSISTGLKIGALAYVGAQIASGIGDSFGNPGFENFGKLFAKSVVHGSAMGVLSKAGGGRFGDGFLGAFAGSLAAPAIDNIYEGDITTEAKAVRITAAAIVGGTASSLGGGNFANGAITAAFVRAFNDEHSMLAAAQRKRPSYAAMEESYPYGDKEDVFDLIGGKVRQNNFENSCTIRMSRALNYSGAEVPFISGETVSGADGGWYIFRVRSMETYLTETYGSPDVILLDNPSDIGALYDKPGILLFDTTGTWQNATGHMTLWNGFGTIDNTNAYFEYSKRVLLWQLPD